MPVSTRRTLIVIPSPSLSVSTASANFAVEEIDLSQGSFPFLSSPAAASAPVASFPSSSRSPSPSPSSPLFAINEAQAFSEDEEVETQVWEFHTGSGETFCPKKDQIIAFVNKGSDKIKMELDNSQIAMYLHDPTAKLVRDLEATHRIPGTKDQEHIPCMVCQLPFARRVGERSEKGVKYDCLKCDAAVAYNKARKGYYMCAMCPLCNANEDLARAIYHSCPQTPAVYPPDMPQDEREEYRCILKLGDTCPCLFTISCLHC